MLRRDNRAVKVYAFSSTRSAYGELVEDSTYTTITMNVYPYSHNKVDDVRYQEVELIGLTRANIDDSNVIEIDSVKYDILFVQKTRRDTAVYMRKQK